MISVVERIDKQRQPMRNYEAAYFLTPSEESVQMLINDFKSGNLYKAAHAFFTEAIPDEIFKMIQKSKVATVLKSLIEVNLSFTAVESKV